MNSFQKTKNGLLSSGKAVLLVAAFMGTSIAFAGSPEGFTADNAKSNAPGEYYLIKGKFKITGPHTATCKRRRNVCGYMPAEPPSLGEGNAFIFPPDFTGPYPDGTYLNADGYMQYDGVTYESTTEDNEEVTIINFN